MLAKALSLSRGAMPRDFSFHRPLFRRNLRPMIIARIKRLIRENNQLRNEIQYLNNEREANALVDSLRRDENEQLLTMLGEETTHYAPVPHQLMISLHDAAEAEDIDQIKTTLQQISGIESPQPQKETA